MNSTKAIELQEALEQFIATELLDGQIVTADQDLLLSGQVDSIGVMRLVAFIERLTEALIPAEDVTIENFSTINTIAQYIAARSE